MIIQMRPRLPLIPNTLPVRNGSCCFDLPPSLNNQISRPRLKNIEERLAIAMGKDNLERGVKRGFSEMIQHTHYEKRRNLEEILSRRIE